MLKGRDVIGLAVINLENGENLGKICDIFCNNAFEKIESFQVCGKTEKEVKYFALTSISSLGRDAVLLKNNQLEEDSPKESCSLQRIKGVKVLCNQGNEIGTTVDVLFDLPEGRIEGIEISEGFIGDLITGRHLVSKDVIKTYNENCIIVAF